MRIAVVIPVGPGHTQTAQTAVNSVKAADLPTGWAVDVIVVMDDEGQLGRSKARNIGAAEAGDVDWYFWLDADDVMSKRAFLILEAELSKTPDLEALWGPIFQRYAMWGPGRQVLDVRENRLHWCVGPVSTFDELLQAGPLMCIHSGCFVKKTLHDKVGGFLEAIDFGEDTEYAWACAAHSKRFRKILDEPLFKILSDNLSADGPRGVNRLDPKENHSLIARGLHADRSRAIANFWQNRGPVPWTRREKKWREHLYGDLGPPWKDEPYRYKPYPSE